jgi:hypothetical protein
MAMFTAYFDASGHPDDVGSRPVLFVSGFVTTVDRWAKFETHWLALLREFGIEPPFHTTDFQSCKGQYASWRDDWDRREAFQSKALHVIKRWTNKPFSSGVVIPDFQRLFKEYEMPTHIPSQPYAYCGLQAAALLKAWADRCVDDGRLKKSRDELKIVFEHGDTHRPELEAALDACGVFVLFDKKECLVPFQACDFLAWQHHRWLTQREERGVRNSQPKKSLLEFTRMFPRDSSTFGNWEAFERECADKGIPKRRP